MDTAQAIEQPSKAQLKHQICQIIQQLTKRGAPPAWQSWDAEKTRQFITNVQGCHAGRSLNQLSLSATLVAQAYDLDLEALMRDGVPK